MNQGPKLLLGVLALGGIVALVVASEKNAHAAGGASHPPILPPLVPPAGGSQIPPSGGVVIVPTIPTGPVPPGGTEPGPTSPLPVIAPLPLPSLPVPSGGGVVPGSPTSTTISLPGIGTFDPATGNVFGPTGVIVGKFNPLNGTFTPTGGAPLSVPLPPVPTTVLPGMTITPGPAPTPNEAPASPAEGSSVVAPDTLTVLSKMLAQEHSPHWRVIPEPTLKPWQQARKLTADGAYGPATALKMASETGMIPIIRAWPKGSQKGKAVPAFQAQLRALASSAVEPRRSQLLAAAAREQGQGYGTPETPIATLITLQDG